MAQIGLYNQTQLETKVSLLPEQIDGNIDNHLLTNLKAKSEGKTGENGIVIKITKIINYDYGMITKTNFMASTVYNVKYECFLCSPVKDLEMICVVNNLIKGYIISKNGPIIAVIQFNNIDTQKFEISNDTIINIKTKREIKVDDYIKVSVINVTNNLGEAEMVAMCKLINFADKNEIEKFKNEQNLLKDDSITNILDDEFI